MARGEDGGGVLGAGGELCSGASQSREVSVVGARQAFLTEVGAEQWPTASSGQSGERTPPSNSQGSQACSELTVWSLREVLWPTLAPASQ